MAEAQILKSVRVGGRRYKAGDEEALNDAISTEQAKSLNERKLAKGLTGNKELDEEEGDTSPYQRRSVGSTADVGTPPRPVGVEKDKKGEPVRTVLGSEGDKAETTPTGAKKAGWLPKDGAKKTGPAKAEGDEPKGDAKKADEGGEQK